MFILIQVYWFLQVKCGVYVCYIKVLCEIIVNII